MIQVRSFQQRLTLLELDHSRKSTSLDNYFHLAATSLLRCSGPEASNWYDQVRYGSYLALVTLVPGGKKDILNFHEQYYSLKVW